MTSSFYTLNLYFTGSKKALKTLDKYMIEAVTDLPLSGSDGDGEELRKYSDICLRRGFQRHLDFRSYEWLSPDDCGRFIERIKIANPDIALCGHDEYSNSSTGMAYHTEFASAVGATSVLSESFREEDQDRIKLTFENAANGIEQQVDEIRARIESSEEGIPFSMEELESACWDGPEFFWDFVECTYSDFEIYLGEFYSYYEETFDIALRLANYLVASNAGTEIIGTVWAWTLGDDPMRFRSIPGERKLIQRKADSSVRFEEE